MALLTHNEMLHMPQIAALMRWIDSHDRPKPTCYNTETHLLHVYSVAVGNGWTDVYHDEINPTLQAARDVLEY